METVVKELEAAEVESACCIGFKINSFYMFSA